MSTIEKTKLAFTNKDNESVIVELTQLDKEDIIAQIEEYEHKIERLMQEHKTRQDKKVIQSSRALRKKEWSSEKEQ